MPTQVSVLALVLVLGPLRELANVLVPNKGCEGSRRIDRTRNLFYNVLRCGVKKEGYKAYKG